MLAGDLGFGVEIVSLDRGVGEHPVAKSLALITIAAESRQCPALRDLEAALHLPCGDAAEQSAVTFDVDPTEAFSSSTCS